MLRNFPIPPLGSNPKPQESASVKAEAMMAEGRDERVRRLRGEGMPAKEIAMGEGLPLSTVYRLCKRGWRERKRKRNNEIRKRAAGGEPQADLAREFGISRQRVHSICMKPSR